METNSFVTRTVIMALLKEKFGEFMIWGRIESKLALKCSDLPEPFDDDRKRILIDGLKDIRSFLIDNGVEPGDVIFIDEEIERYEYTKQISLYEEQEDQIPPDIINKYMRLSYGTEGVIGIHLGYNYDQLRRLTNGIYKVTNLIKFYISREKTVYGKIVAEIFEHPQKIPVATLLESRKIDKATGRPTHKKIALFGDKVNGAKYVKLKEIEVSFYVYRFITEFNQDFILFTKEQKEIGDYIITGVVTQCDDYKALTDSHRLPTKLPFLFAQTCRNRIVKFSDHGEFRSRLRKLGVFRNTIFDIPFTIRKKDSQYILNQPTWFKWLTWAWLCHSNKGLFNPYPFHILMVGDPHSGKSWMLNALHNRSKETRRIFSGSSSTMKNLVPSFRYNPAKLGYLAESNRFAFCDEFLRCLMNTTTGQVNPQREESVAAMNDLLEHQKREAGSGNSRVNVNMTSRVLATTNPIREIHCVEDLINKLDPSFLSRWLIYYQTDSHVNLIRKSKDKKLKGLNYHISDNDWVSLLDYLHSFHASYDTDRLDKIQESVIPILSENLKNHYAARHGHHIECLMDGIIKARCLFDRESNFNAKECDYQMLESVWKHVISSWVDIRLIQGLPVRERIFYLPENTQYIYTKITKEKKPLSKKEIEELVLEHMSPNDFIEAMVILEENGLIKNRNGMFIPYSLEVK